MASFNSKIESESEDEIWKHKPLMRIRKSFHQISSSQHFASTKPRSCRRGPGIPQTQGGAPTSAVSRTALTQTPRTGRLQTQSQTRRNIFHSSQKQAYRSNKNLSSESLCEKLQSQVKVKSAKSRKAGCDAGHELELEGKPVTDIVKMERAKTAEIEGNYCPICQAPFTSIHLTSPEMHIQECLEFATPESECPEGLQCDVTILSHYQKFSHKLLALARSEKRPGESSKMDEGDCEGDRFTHLKSEVMSSDSDFERPSCSMTQPFKVVSTPCEDYDFTIKGERVVCTPKKQCFSQITDSQAKSKQKNTARKSARGAINKSQRDSKRMPVVKEEKNTPKHFPEIKKISTVESIAKQGSHEESAQTPRSHGKSASMSGISSAKRRKSSPEGDIPSSRTLLDYFSPSQKTADVNMNEIPLSPHTLDDASLSGAESVDIFATPKKEFQNDKLVIDAEATALRIPKKSNKFVQLKPKKGMERAPDLSPSRDDNLEKMTDEPLFDILGGLEDTTDAESESIFSLESKSAEKDDSLAGNESRWSRNPNFAVVPPAPLEDDDATNTSDDDLPQVDFTLTCLDELCEKDKDAGDEDVGQQKLPAHGALEPHEEAVEEDTQDEESERLFDIPNKNKESESPTLDSNEAKSDIHIESAFSDSEESQSLFQIPCRIEKNDGTSPSAVIQEGILDDAVRMCSENEEEDMEVDNEDDDNIIEASSVALSSMSTVEYGKSMTENTGTGSLESARRAEQVVPAKPRKQGTLDFFLGCKPAAKPEPPAPPKQQKGSWRGSRRTQERNKDSSQVTKEWGNNSGKQCPFYKKMPGTSFTVDAFRYGVIPGCKAYFLSHFHYDHYGGLTKHFDQQLYCSKVTGNLVISRLKVAAQHVNTLPMNEPCIIDDVEVTLLDANHCPGSVMFLYKLRSGAVYLHTGDFRADPKMENYPELTRCRVNQLYLDTTYCDPQYKFPSQKEVIAFAVQTAVQAVKWNKKTLIVCGTYTIGKEKVFRAIADALACKVYVESQKLKVLECLEDSDLMSLLTRDSLASRLHVIGMNMFNHQKLKEYLSQFSPRYDSILAFKPTGWTHSEKVESPSSIKPSKSGASVLYGIPYSEHSSYSEMKRFVQFLRPDKILPTVNNGNPKSRKAMEDIFQRWMEENGRSSSPTKLQSGNIKNWFRK